MYFNWVRKVYPFIWILFGFDIFKIKSEHFSSHSF